MASFPLHPSLHAHSSRRSLPPHSTRIPANTCSEIAERAEWSRRKTDPVHRLLPPSLTADADCPCVGNVGGRTAWSSTVTIQDQTIAARYWYDGQYINNAKEDAAEFALKTLNQQPRSSTVVYPGQLFPHQSSGYGRGF